VFRAEGVTRVTVTAPAAAISFQDRIAYLMSRLDYRLAGTPDEYEAIYRLRYDAYLREEAIAPSRSQRLHDRFDEAPNSWTFGLYLDGRLCTSIRISHASGANFETPAVDAFSDLLLPEIEAGRTVVDPNRFVADYEASRLYPELPYITVRLGFVASEYFGSDLGTATVRREHQAFYRKVFGLKPLCEPRPYPTLTKPLCLMLVEYPKVRETILSRFPFMRSTFFERRMLFERRQPVADPLRREVLAG
jgi:hypothetical protein